METRFWDYLEQWRQRFPRRRELSWHDGWLQNALVKGLLVSVDSLSQLDLLGSLNPGGKVMVRFNPGIGAGHHAKVITAGKAT